MIFIDTNNVKPIMGFEQIVLSNLTYNEEYRNQVLHAIKEEYFTASDHGILFRLIANHYKDHKTTPTKESLLVDLKKLPDIHQRAYDDTTKLICEQLPYP